MSKFKIVPSEEGISVEDAMLEFNSVYIPIANVADRFNEVPDEQRSKIYGKVAQSVDSRIGKEAKELGLTLEGKLHENVETVIGALKTQIVELKEANEKLKDSTDKAAKAEIEKLTQKVNDLTTLNEKLKNDYEGVANEKVKIETEFTQKQLELIINNKLNLAKSEYVLVEDINIRDACTFDESKFKFTLDESQNEVVYDSNGQAVLSKVKAGAFADYKEVLESIYTKRGAFKKVIGGGGVNQPVSGERPKLQNRTNLAENVTLGKK